MNSFKIASFTECLNFGVEEQNLLVKFLDKLAATETSSENGEKLLATLDRLCAIENRPKKDSTFLSKVFSLQDSSTISLHDFIDDINASIIEVLLNREQLFIDRENLLTLEKNVRQCLNRLKDLREAKIELSTLDLQKTLDNRFNDLNVSVILSEQTLLKIKIILQNIENLIEKIQSYLVTTLPVLKLKYPKITIPEIHNNKVVVTKSNESVIYKKLESLNGSQTKLANNRHGLPSLEQTQNNLKLVRTLFPNAVDEGMMGAFIEYIERKTGEKWIYGDPNGFYFYNEMMKYKSVIHPNLKHRLTKIEEIFGKIDSVLFLSPKSNWWHNEKNSAYETLVFINLGTLRYKYDHKYERGYSGIKALNVHYFWPIFAFENDRELFLPNWRVNEAKLKECEDKKSVWSFLPGNSNVSTPYRFLSSRLLENYEG